MTARDAYYADLHEILVLEKVVAKADLDEALREVQRTKESLVEVLFRLDKIDDKALVHVLSSRYGFTAVNPAVFVIENELLELIPRKIAEKHLVLPISLYENTLTVAFANPTNLKAIDEIKAITGKRIKIAVAAFSILKKLMTKYYAESGPGTPGSVPKDKIDDLVKMIEDEQQDVVMSSTQDLMKGAHETPVIRLVNMMIIEAIRRRASDLFIEPWEHYVRVRARVDGLLEEIVRPPKTLGSALVSRIKVMSELNIAEHRIPQDGRFKVKLNEREVDMRVSILPTSFGEKVCLRVLDTKNQSHDIAKLGFSPDELEIIKESAVKPHGMILVTGPTGSGKTTTLYSILKYLDSPEINITTVEDPVEYQIPGMNQVQVRENIGMRFPTALRSILRQDPDVILIGEIRDAETLDIAVKAALTGHLVLSTLHTNDAISSVTRMINMGLEPFLISSTVLMISAQRLVRKLCTKCRQPEEVPAEILRQLALNPGGKYNFMVGKGCSQCRQTGYSGRSVITEIFQMKPEFTEMIMNRATAEEVKTAARKAGMVTLRGCAVRKAMGGETSLEEVFRVTSEDVDPAKQEMKPAEKESGKDSGKKSKRVDEAA